MKKGSMSQKADLLRAEALLDALLGTAELADETGLDDASLLHVPGQSGLAGLYQGEEAILGLLRRMEDLTDRSLRFSPSRVLTENDQTVVVFGHTRGARGETPLDTGTVHILCLREGIVREIRTFHENQAGVDEFWAE
jgi:ketosteroid isomerase-like protein